MSKTIRQTCGYRREAFEVSQVKVNLSVAKDGVQAVDFLRNRGKFKEAPRPDLILLALNLPRKTVAKSFPKSRAIRISKTIELDDFMGVLRTIEDFWFTKATLPLPEIAFMTRRPVDAPR